VIRVCRVVVEAGLDALETENQDKLLTLMLVQPVLMK
jgi:hypothetical protein